MGSTSIYTHAIPESQKPAGSEGSWLSVPKRCRVCSGTRKRKSELIERKHVKKSWSRGADLNRRPADSSTDSLLLVLNAFSLTSPHDSARYSAPIVRKLFARRFQNPYRQHAHKSLSLRGPSRTIPSLEKYLIFERA